MREALSFFMPGLPVAKGRPKFVRATGRAFTPAKTVAAERGIAQFAAAAMAGRPLFNIPVELRVVAYLLPPKTRTKAERALPWAGFRGSRPDVDNYIKAVMDACIGVVFTDDALVASIHAAKIYDVQPGLRVCVEPLSWASWPVRRTPDAPAGLFAETEAA
jgi:Holliday junction resolvase RusA-like endonuclease